MRRTIGNQEIELCGDPHLGRRFVRGVPLDRRGELEAKQREEFILSLANAPKNGMWVCMGDIFDGMTVSNEVVLWTARLILTHAVKNTETEYVILRGNHDASRDADKRSSFDLLEALLESLPNVFVVKDEVVVKEGLAFIPWHPFKDAAEMAEQVDQTVHAAFGHWDVDSYGGSDSNLIPIEQLKDKTTLLVTGHDHNAREIERDGCMILVTGSMMPYGHDQDPNGTLYRTVSLDELDELIASGEAKDLVIRLELAEGEEAPEPPDCLGFKIKPIKKEDDPEETVEVGDFDMKELWDEAFGEKEVDLGVSGKVWAFFQELKSGSH